MGGSKMTNEIRPTAMTTAREIQLASTGTSLEIMPRNFGEIVTFAQFMSKAGCAVPKYLQGNDGACLAVILQAMKWGMDPFAVAWKKYEVDGRLADEAQLITAVILAHAPIADGEDPDYSFDGEGETLRCTVRIKLRNGKIKEYASPPIGPFLEKGKHPTFAHIHPKNSPLWRSDPRQQLAYYSIRAWARRHAPHIIMGVYDREELEAIEPQQPPAIVENLASRLAKATPSEKGFQWNNPETDGLTTIAALGHQAASRGTAALASWLRSLNNNEFELIEPYIAELRNEAIEGQVHVHTHATDAAGIARDIKPALEQPAPESEEESIVVDPLADPLDPELQENLSEEQLLSELETRLSAASSVDELGTISREIGAQWYKSASLGTKQKSAALFKEKKAELLLQEQAHEISGNEYSRDKNGPQPYRPQCKDIALFKCAEHIAKSNGRREFDAWYSRLPPKDLDMLPVGSPDFKYLMNLARQKQ
jgi:RecT family